MLIFIECLCCRASDDNKNILNQEEYKTNMCVVAVTGHIKNVIIHKHLHNIRNTIPITVLGTMIYVNVD